MAKANGLLGQFDGTGYDVTFHAQDDDQRAVHLVFLPFASMFSPA